jgi:hypothetical protein
MVQLRLLLTSRKAKRSRLRLAERHAYLDGIRSSVVTQPQTLQLDAVYEGTTWEGINSVTLEMPAGTPLNLTGAQLQMVYRRVGERAERLAMGVNTGIQITNATGGVFRVLPQVLPLTVGLYYWEIIVILSTGLIVPLFAGTQEITRIGSAS